MLLLCIHCYVFIIIVVCLRLFCKVSEFTRKNLDMLFPSVKQPSAKVLSPGAGEDGKLSDADQSYSAAKCIFSLLESIIESMDIK